MGVIFFTVCLKRYIFGVYSLTIEHLAGCPISTWKILNGIGFLILYFLGKLLFDMDKLILHLA